ncbi:hypothetical protein, partial [Bacillus pacificus]|uniref:hypothetical protein n=1 Tax=Bacillus pacificus TaxID=2026187 RepID=UPI002E24C8C0|nr:hypothetical protein [Bacillus pacificus]
IKFEFCMKRGVKVKTLRRRAIMKIDRPDFNFYVYEKCYKRSIKIVINKMKKHNKQSLYKKKK